MGRETAALRSKTLEEEGGWRIGGFCFCGLVEASLVIAGPACFFSLLKGPAYHVILRRLAEQCLRFFLNDLKIARTMHQLNVLFFKRENRIQRYTPPIHERVKIIFQLLVIVAFS